MSTVRTPLTRLSGSANRARNSEAAFRIAAGLSPRGQVWFASLNSSNGFSPSFSGLSIAAISNLLLSLSGGSTIPPPRGSTRVRIREGGQGGL